MKTKKAEKEYPDLSANPQNIKVGDWVRNRDKFGQVTERVSSGICQFWVHWSGDPVPTNQLASLLFKVDYLGSDLAGKHFDGGHCYRLLFQDNEIKAEVILDDGAVKIWALERLLSTLESATNKPEIASVEVVDDELTEEEESDRFNLERKVERAFSEAGKALKELRDRRLYRSTHSNFEQYCQDRFGFGRHAANRLISCANVVENLLTIGHQNQSEEMVTIWHQNQSEEMVTIGHQNQSEKMVTIGHQNQSEKMLPNWQQILPTNEYQCRPLTKLEPEQQREAWIKAVESAGGKVPSGRIVKDIVQRIKERTKKAVPNPYHKGEVCKIIASDDPELKGRGGEWCIVSEVHEFSCTVKTYQGEITVRLDNLRLVDYSTADCEAVSKLCARLSSLYSDDLEEAARWNLTFLGKLSRPYLTALEEKLLEFLEAQKY